MSKMDPEYIEISTKVGKLKGLVKKSELAKKTYYSYQGIPYAKPPLGELRFKAPVPYGKWSGVKDATKTGSDSLQRHMLLKNVCGSEDCLYLNVYSPQGPDENDIKKAVMVWIHGGGYLGGSGSTDMYGPDFLIEQDILLVTINYRLGALGFLSLGSTSCPGNAGLKDQSLALQWVKDNIASFGGDPGNVTIFGESAGSGSVHCQILSPLSRGLFHKAILQSGTALCEWSFQTNPRELALKFVAELGCTSKDDDQILKFLQSVSAEDIEKCQEAPSLKTEKDGIHKYGLLWLPCVEVAGDSPALPDFPRKLMEKGEFAQVPIMIGVTDMEGLLSLVLKLAKFEIVNEDVTVMVPYDLKITKGSSQEKNLAKEILKFYSGKESLTWEFDDILSYSDFQSDIGFVIALAFCRQFFLKQNVPLYSYLYTYNSARSLSSFMLPAVYPDLAPKLATCGASHGDELLYQFKSYLKEFYLPPTDEDKAFMDKFLKAWTTFAKTGNPNCKELGVEWKPDSIQKPSYMKLGKECEAVNTTLYPKRIEFWQKIYDKYSCSY